MSSFITFPTELWLQILLSGSLEDSDYAALCRVATPLLPIAQPFLFSRMAIQVYPDLKAIKSRRVYFQTYIDNAKKRLDYFHVNWAKTVKSISLISKRFPYIELDEIDSQGIVYRHTCREIIDAVFDRLGSFPNVQSLHIDNFIVEQRYFSALENCQLKDLTFYRCYVKRTRYEEDNEDYDSEEESDSFRDEYADDSAEDVLPPSGFHIQHLRQIVIIKNALSPCISTWQGLIDPSSIEEIVANRLCSPLLKVLRRIPLLSKLTTLRLPEAHLRSGQIDAFKDVLTKCPNLVHLELGSFLRLGHDIPITISPNAVPKLKYLTADLQDIPIFLPTRPIELISLTNHLTFRVETAQSMMQLSLDARRLRHLVVTYCVRPRDEHSMILLAFDNICTHFDALEEFELTMTGSSKPVSQDLTYKT
ncbi:hypothetical protein C8Q75DRAFT_255582 [Abortiporus biennis]|nr:hypothetical protein C8Q75DRAFT_255582 [Abortiporus biennis]